jgi:hypothetical protein
VENIGRRVVIPEGWEDEAPPYGHFCPYDYEWVTDVVECSEPNCSGCENYLVTRCIWIAGEGGTECSMGGIGGGYSASLSHDTPDVFMSEKSQERCADFGRSSTNAVMTQWSTKGMTETILQIISAASSELKKNSLTLT